MEWHTLPTTRAPSWALGDDCDRANEKLLHEDSLCMYPPLDTKSSSFSHRVSLIQLLQLGKSSAYQPGKNAERSRSRLGTTALGTDDTSSLHEESMQGEEDTSLLKVGGASDGRFLATRARDRVVCPFPRCRKFVVSR